MKHSGGFAANGDSKCQASCTSKPFDSGSKGFPSLDHRQNNFCDGARRSENMEHVAAKDPAFSRTPNQVLAEIQCHPSVGDDLGKASQHLKEAANSLDNGVWVDRQHYQQEVKIKLIFLEADS